MDLLTRKMRKITVGFAKVSSTFWSSQNRCRREISIEIVRKVGLVQNFDIFDILRISRLFRYRIWLKI